jgi:hypothetical protein
MRGIRELMIITGALCASSYSWSIDRDVDAVCARYLNPSFFDKWFGTLDPTESAREFDWCVNEKSRSTIITIDLVYRDGKIDDSKFRKSREEMTEANEVRLWKNSTSQDNGTQTASSMASFRIKGRQEENLGKQEKINSLNGFTTISE